MKQLRMIRIMIPVLAGCMFFDAAFFAVDTGVFLYNAKSASGTIVATEERTTKDSQKLHRPTFTFEASGRTYTVTPSAFASPSPGGVGEQVRILCDELIPSGRG
jgi:hypothetical protein